MVPAAKILRPWPPLRPPAVHQCVASQGSVPSRRGRGPDRVAAAARQCSGNHPSVPPPAVVWSPDGCWAATNPPSKPTLCILRCNDVNCSHAPVSFVAVSSQVRQAGWLSVPARCRSCLRLPFIQIGCPPPAERPGSCPAPISAGGTCDPGVVRHQSQKGLPWSPSSSCRRWRRRRAPCPSAPTQAGPGPSPTGSPAASLSSSSSNS